MKNQTAEEILRNCYREDMHHTDPLGFQPYIYKAMHQFAAQQSALAVAKRDDEIRKWAKSFKYNDPIWVEMVARNETLDELITFLSTTTSAEIAQVEPTKKPNNCKCTVEETSGWTIVKCCNICGLPIQKENWYFVQPEPSIPIREIEELRDEMSKDIQGLDLLTENEIIQALVYYVGQINKIICK